MPDNKEQIEPSDHFSKYIQYRLKGHQLVPDDICWQKIEWKMSNHTRKRTLWIISFGIIAAAVNLLLLLDTSPVKEDALIKEMLADKNVTESKAMGKIFSEKTVLPAPVIAKKTPKRLADTLKINPVPVVNEEHVPDSILSEKEAEDPPSKDVFLTEKKEYRRAYRSLSELEPIRKKKSKSWLLTAAFGTGADASPLGTYMYENDFLASPSTDLESNYGHIPVPTEIPHDIRQPEEFDDISHDLPLSFGITLRKNLNERMALETGLVYTYLSTHLKRQRDVRLDGKLNLHYLGIPANLVIYLWNDKTWNVYLSGGFMVEKGLRSIYKQQIYSGFKIDETEVWTSISGLQWSANGSVGVSYRFYKEWSFYAEPRISYYFDTNQPISIRTERKTNIGIGAGIRYEF